MPVARIHIENFRGVAECTIEGLPTINVLIGRNNCGKSSVVEAASRLLGNINGHDVRGRDIADAWRAIRRESQRNSEQMVRASATTLGVDVTLEGNQVLSWRADRVSPQDEVRTTARPNPVNVQLGLFAPQDAFDPSIEARLWPELLRTRGDRELARSTTTIFGTTVDSLQMLPNGDLVVGLPDAGIRLDGQGNGFRAALRLLMVVASTRNGVCVVEEPETHQHPASLRELASILVATVVRNSSQLFVTTHSLECVRAFARADGGVRPAPSFAAWSLERGENGVIRPRGLTRELLLGLDEQGTDVRFLDEYL